LDVAEDTWKRLAKQEESCSKHRMWIK